MPRANTVSRSLDDLTVGELRAVLAWDREESATVAEVLAAHGETAQVMAAYEIDTRQYAAAYVDRRNARHAAALAEAAARADKGARGQGSGAAMAARQEARLEADELFARRSPLLDFADWVRLDRPDVHEVEVGVIRRSIAAMTELVR
jgi:hypothetical protein